MTAWAWSGRRTDADPSCRAALKSRILPSRADSLHLKGGLPNGSALEEAAEELGRRRADEQAQVSRAAEGAVGGAEDDEERAFLSVWDLVQEARDIARWVMEHRLRLREWADAVSVEEEEVTVSEMIEVLRRELAVVGGAKLDGFRLLREQATPARRSCLFLGMLEMAQKQELEIEQGEVFGAISVVVVQREGALE